MNDEPEMSREELNQLYNKTAAPAGITVVAFILYLYYLLENSILTPSSPLFEFFLKWAIPFLFTLTLVIAVAVEVANYLRVRKTIGFHMKRFGMKMLLFFLLSLPFFGLFELLSSTLTPFVGYRPSAVLACLLYALLIAAITYRFQRVIRRIWKEP